MSKLETQLGGIFSLLQQFMPYFEGCVQSTRACGKMSEAITGYDDERVSKLEKQVGEIYSILQQFMPPIGDQCTLTPDRKVNELGSQEEKQGGIRKLNYQKKVIYFKPTEGIVCPGEKEVIIL